MVASRKNESRKSKGIKIRLPSPDAYIFVDNQYRNSFLSECSCSFNSKYTLKQHRKLMVFQTLKCISYSVQYSEMCTSKHALFAVTKFPMLQYWEFYIEASKILGSQESSVMSMIALISLPFDINVITISHLKFWSNNTPDLF